MFNCCVWSKKKEGKGIRMIIGRNKFSWIWITIFFAFTLAFVSRANSEEKLLLPKGEQAKQILDKTGVS